MRLPFLLALALPFSAHAQVRDSLGIHIVENTRPTWTAAQAQHLAPMPSLVIGTRPGPNNEFSRIAGAARLTDGRVVVADGASSQLRFYDPNGAFIKSSGRKGEGPGEFPRLDLMSLLPGDTIAAGSSTGFVSLFTGTGTFLRVLNPNAPSVGLPSGPRGTIAVLNPNARVLSMMGRFPFRAQGTRWIESMPFTMFNGNNGVIRSLGALPSYTVEMTKEGPIAPIFAPMAVFAASPTSFFFGFPSEFSIQVYSAKGPLERIIRRQWTPVKVTAADWDTYVDEWSKRWINKTGADSAKERAEVQNASRMPTLPAYSQFVADHVGRLWVRDLRVSDAPGSGQIKAFPTVQTSWSVFDAAGKWLGDVTMPARFMPMDIGVDYVLGVARDADGVETVVMYKMK